MSETPGLNPDETKGSKPSLKDRFKNAFGKKKPTAELQPPVVDSWAVQKQEMMKIPQEQRDPTPSIVDKKLVFHPTVLMYVDGYKTAAKRFYEYSQQKKEMLANMAKPGAEGTKLYTDQEKQDVDQIIESSRQAIEYIGNLNCVKVFDHTLSALDTNQPKAKEKIAALFTELNKQLDDTSENSNTASIAARKIARLHQMEQDLAGAKDKLQRDGSVEVWMIEPNDIEPYLNDLPLSTESPNIQAILQPAAEQPNTEGQNPATDVASVLQGVRNLQEAAGVQPPAAAANEQQPARGWKNWLRRNPEATGPRETTEFGAVRPLKEIRETGPQTIEDVLQLAGAIDGDEFRKRRIEKNYGKGFWGKFKAAFAGEYRFDHDKAGGARSKWWKPFTDLGRKFVVSAVNKRVVGATLGMVAAGLLTGGIGTAAWATVAGSGAGRLIGEFMVGSDERELRKRITEEEQQLATSIRELANTIKTESLSPEDKAAALKELLDMYFQKGSSEAVKNLSDTNVSLQKEREAAIIARGRYQKVGELLGAVGGLAHNFLTGSFAPLKTTTDPGHAVERIGDAWNYVDPTSKTGLHSLVMGYKFPWIAGLPEALKVGVVAAIEHGAPPLAGAYILDRGPSVTREPGSNVLDSDNQRRADNREAKLRKQAASFAPESPVAAETPVKGEAYWKEYAEALGLFELPSPGQEMWHRKNGADYDEVPVKIMAVDWNKGSLNIKSPRRVTFANGKQGYAYRPQVIGAKQFLDSYEPLEPVEGMPITGGNRRAERGPDDDIPHTREEGRRSGGEQPKVDDSDDAETPEPPKQAEEKKLTDDQLKKIAADNFAYGNDAEKKRMNEQGLTDAEKIYAQAFADLEAKHKQALKTSIKSMTDKYNDFANALRIKLALPKESSSDSWAKLELAKHYALATDSNARSVLTLEDSYVAADPLDQPALQREIVNRQLGKDIHATYAKVGDLPAGLDTKRIKDFFVAHPASQELTAKESAELGAEVRALAERVATENERKKARK